MRKTAARRKGRVKKAAHADAVADLPLAGDADLPDFWKTLGRRLEDVWKTLGRRSQDAAPRLLHGRPRATVAQPGNRLLRGICKRGRSGAAREAAAENRYAPGPNRLHAVSGGYLPCRFNFRDDSASRKTNRNAGELKSLDINGMCKWRRG